MKCVAWRPLCACAMRKIVVAVALFDRHHPHPKMSPQGLDLVPSSTTPHCLVSPTEE